jgi:8-oxo-dGTP pyrophosphatase MutT (NUDIX family)
MDTSESDPGMLSAPLPEAWAARVRAHLEGRAEIAAPRPAATVVLLREGPGGMQAYLLRRAPSMAFAAGYHAFPGGSLDPGDSDAPAGWAGPPPQAWARWFGCDPGHASALVCAAVRETFEECGVLLAGPDEHETVGDTGGQRWEEDRRALVEHRCSLAQLLGRRALVLRADLLAGWSRWITPEFEARRYDTAFFVAALPPGQRARDVSGEADRVDWIGPGDADAEHAAGRVHLLPPTLATLRAVAAHRDAAAVLAAARGRVITAITPQVRPGPDGGFLVQWPR